jgi:hypothetical protein
VDISTAVALADEMTAPEASVTVPTIVPEFCATAKGVLTAKPTSTIISHTYLAIDDIPLDGLNCK